MSEQETTEGDSHATRRGRRRARRRARSRARRWITRVGIALVLLVVAIAGSTFGYFSWRLDQIRRVHSHHVVRATGPTENILLIGSTDRCAATKIKQYALQCSEGVNGINSDVVLVVHLDPGTGKASILSIPRDTFVPAARSGGLYNKIDAALVDGPDQLVAAIEQDFGIPINHFVVLNFDTFAAVVNALGGLHLYFRYRLVDASSNLHVHHTGCIYFNGNEALELVRSRHLYWFAKGEKPNLKAIQAATDNGTYYTADSGGHYDGTGDLGRIIRVHLFLQALATAVHARGLGNPLTDNALIGAVAPNLTVDSTFGNSEILRLALDFRNANIANTPELTAPIVNDASSYYYKGYYEGLVVFPTEPQDQRAIDEFLGTKPPGLKLHPSSISVAVVDGTNSATATAAVGAELRALGYRVVPTAAVHYTGPVSETTIEYTPGHLQQAERVLSSLSGTVVLGEYTPAQIMGEFPAVAGADVTVIAGSDLAVARPTTITPTSTTPTTPTSTSTASTTTTTRQAGSTVPTPLPTAVTPTTSAPAVAQNPNLGAPTSVSPPVAPFDPRTCPTRSK